MKHLQEFAESFEQRERENGEKYYCLKDGSPEWMQDVVYNAHLDRLPNDQSYEIIYHLAQECADRFDPELYDDIDDFRDEIHEIADSLVDPYTTNLTAWLHSHLDNVEYLERGIEMGADTGWKLLAYAQYEWIMDTAGEMLSALEEVELIETE